MASRWIAVDEVGNDNLATSIYEDDFKGLLVCRCNQNGQYPWQAPAIILGLEQSRASSADSKMKSSCESQPNRSSV